MQVLWVLSRNCLSQPQRLQNPLLLYWCPSVGGFCVDEGDDLIGEGGGDADFAGSGDGGAAVARCASILFGGFCVLLPPNSLFKKLIGFPYFMFLILSGS
jgi:hypothetical protein